MDVRTHLRLIWRYRVQIVVLSVVLAAVVFLLTSGRADRFTADARLQVVTEVESGSPAERSVFLANSYAELGETTPVLAAAATASGLDVTADDVGRRTDVEADDLGFVRVNAEASTQEEATGLVVGLVDALTASVDARAASQFQTALEQLDVRIAELRALIENTPPDSVEAQVLVAELDAVVATRSDLAVQSLDRLEVVEPPLGDDAPLPSGTLGITLTALIVALILNAELAVGFHLLSDRIFVDDPDEVEAVTGLPVLASIALRDGRAAAESFRQLRLSMALYTDAPVKRLVVVGSGDGSMRTDISIGIAEATADLGVRVTLVDADLRDPGIHKRFKMAREPGLGDYATGTAASGIVRPVDGEPYLQLCTAGRPVDDPGRFIALNIESVFARISESGSLVVNTPDAVKWSDAAAIAARCDGSVMVLSEGARRRASRSLAKQLAALGGHPIGVIVHTGAR